MTTPKQMLELADELERAHTLYLNQFGISPNHEIKRGKLAQLLWDDKQTFIEALRLAAQADAPAILPQQMREAAAEAIRTFCKSLGTNVVVVSSDDVERIYYSGISVDALSAAIAIALTRPECLPTENKGELK